jgi:tRNA(fMet)-specific endonuclease VapC
MPLTHLLDTSVYSQLIRPAVPATVTARWNLVGDDAMVISSICEAEVLFGIKKKGAIRLLRDYEFILKGRYHMLAIDADVAATYADLRVVCESAGSCIQDMDLLIAATAKTHNLIVATLNYSDFSRIPGLAVEDWSQPPSNSLRTQPT